MSLTVNNSWSYDAYQNGEVVGSKTFDNLPGLQKSNSFKEESKLPYHDDVAAKIHLSIEVPNQKNKENNPSGFLKDFVDYSSSERTPAVKKVNETVVHTLSKNASTKKAKEVNVLPLRSSVVNLLTKEDFNNLFVATKDSDVNAVTECNNFRFVFKKHKIIVRGPATHLYLALVSRGSEGTVVSKAIGNFTPDEVQKYINGDRNCLVFEFIEKAFDLFPNTKIFAAGMYNESCFEEFGDALIQEHQDVDLQGFINPCNVDQDLLETLNVEDLENFLNEFDYEINFGISGSGRVCVSNGSKYSEDFRKFTLEEFTSWCEIQEKLLAISKIPLYPTSE